MNKISCIIVNKNSARDLANCLESVKGFADETIIVDLESTDLSKQVAQKYKARFMTYKSVPIVEHVRQKSFKFATHDYILLLDPDERLTTELTKELKNLLKDEPDFFEIPRKNIIFGKWMQHSRWWPDYQIRLFKKNKISWPSNIHSQPTTEGTGVVVAANEKLAIEHHNYRNLDDLISKNIRYAKAEANDCIQAHKKLNLNNTVHKALSEFFSRFFAGHGYRDGMHGFVLAFFQMIYYFLVYFYYWELKEHFDLSEQELTSNAIEYFKKGTVESAHWSGKAKNIGIFSKLRLKLASKLLRSR